MIRFRWLLVAGLALGFGAVDQYLGSLWSTTHLGTWSVDLSMMSAPWLALPFLVGTRIPDPARASLGGALVTTAALLGYFAMTLSPIEGVRLSQIHPIEFVASQLHVLLPAALTGPVWGWVGYRWRLERSWWSAALVVGAFCLEPAARLVYGQPFRAGVIAIAEVLVGILLTALIAVTGRAKRSSDEAV